MGLVTVEFTPSADGLPPRVASVLANSRLAVADLEESSRASIPAFVPSDYEIVYRALVAIKSDRLATGRRFIEWGSGLGAVTCLAALIGFDAVGIEIESRLVERSQKFASEHEIAAQFAAGSFVPSGEEPQFDWGGDVNWLSTDGGADGYAELELEPDDFDVVFAYPWPGEEQVIFDLFSHSAAVGALLLTYHGLEGVRLQRKVRR